MVALIPTTSQISSCNLAEEGVDSDFELGDLETHMDLSFELFVSLCGTANFSTHQKEPHSVFCILTTRTLSLCFLCNRICCSLSADTVP